MPSLLHWTEPSVEQSSKDKVVNVFLLLAAPVPVALNETELFAEKYGTVVVAVTVVKFVIVVTQHEAEAVAFGLDAMTKVLVPPMVVLVDRFWARQEGSPRARKRMVALKEENERSIATGIEKIDCFEDEDVESKRGERRGF